MEDDYAADGEGPVVPRRDSRRRTSRLRQRPPTKRDVPHLPADADAPATDEDNLSYSSPPSIPTPPPLSPLSPRWASLASKSTALYQPTSPPARPKPDPPTPRRSTSSSSSPFVGLSSHPYVPAAEEADLPPRPKTSNGSVSGVGTPFSKPSSRPNSPPSSKKEPRTSTMENFSRPRKPSVRQHPYDVTPVRIRPPEPPLLDQTLPQSQSAWPRDRARGLSISSNKSSSTYASVSKRPSNDHLYRHAAPPRASGGMTSPGLPRPPIAYSRSDIAPGLPTLTREPLPWLADDELRSSYRSQLTASTTQGTLFTPSSTERSSVLTKASSRTSASLLGGTGLAADEGLSVEDVMGMYEKGFYSTGAEDEDTDLCLDDHTDYAEPSVERPGTSRSNGSDIGSRLTEAIGDSLPIPPGAVPVPGQDMHVLRDSGAFFRNSGLPSSLPTHTGLGMTEEARGRAGQHVGSSSRLRDDFVLAADLDDMRLTSSKQSIDSGKWPHGASSLGRPSTAGAVERGTARPPSAADSSRQGGLWPSVQSPPLSQQDADTRDRYGFRKQNQHITREQYDEWDGSYTEYIARRRKKWVAYLKDSGLTTDNPTRFPPPGPKTKRFIRKGVPPEWRGSAWFYYANGPAILAKNPGVYQDLAERAARGEAKTVDAEAIERDLHRTFPDNVKFRVDDNQPATGEVDSTEPEIISGLRRVLLAFSIHHPRIGYCQSLNFLAGLLLLFVETEEQCFWLLNVITTVHLPGTHETSLEGSKVDLGLLMAELQDSMPAIWAKVGAELEDGTPGARPPQPLAKHGTLGRKSRRPRPTTSRSADALGAADRLPPITLCMTAWFMSCFIGTLPIETTLRVWDVLFYEGSKTLFRVALGIFKLGEAEIRAVADPMEMFSVVQAIPRRLLDCNLVMEATFRRRNGFGHLSQESIDEKRRERREVLRGTRDGKQTAADDARLVTSPSMPGLTGLVDEPATTIRRKGTLFGRRKERRPLDV